MELFLIIPLVALVILLVGGLIFPFALTLFFIVESLLPDRTDYSKKYDPDGF